MTRVLLISDTHLGPDQPSRLIERIHQHLETADAILHAGDITSIEVLGALSQFAPVHAVLGNNDHGLLLPERRLVEIDGFLIGMIHDSGPARDRGRRLHRMFPSADAVVFGHSHAPWNERDERPSDGHAQRHVNPGSAMQRRLQPNCTVAILEIDATASSHENRITARHIAV